MCLAPPDTDTVAAVVLVLDMNIVLLFVFLGVKGGVPVSGGVGGVCGVWGTGSGVRGVDGVRGVEGVGGVEC